MRGLMMDRPLLISAILRHAALQHRNRRSCRSPPISRAHRYTFREAFARTRKLANALQRLGVQPGDRVATLAWNDFRHFELYYGVSCSGLVCHTINPRLFEEQIAYIVNHAEDRWLFLDPVFVPLIEKLQPQLPKLEGCVILTDDAHMPTSRAAQARSYESSDRGPVGPVRVAGVRRAHGQLALLHVGHDGRPEGRALQPSLDGAAHLRVGAARRDGARGSGRRAAGRADVPRQRLGAAVRLRDGRREAGVPGAEDGRGETCSR